MAWYLIKQRGNFTFTFTFSHLFGTTVSKWFHVRALLQYSWSTIEKWVV